MGERRSAAPSSSALALLLRATDRDTALAHYEAFTWQIIARLPQDRLRAARGCGARLARLSKRG